MAKPPLHEIGHIYGAELADYGPQGSFIETYSDSIEDPTVERIENNEEQTIMSRSWEDKLLMDPMNGYYYAYSIEELSLESAFEACSEHICATGRVESRCGTEGRHRRTPSTTSNSNRVEQF
jgi:hypothetical protein